MASFARIDELRKKFEENPRRYFAPLANEYRKAGQVDQAIAICREYLPQQPGHMSGHIVYGQALYEARQFEEGKTVFETALSLDPENLIALRHLGDIALIIGDHDGARGWYRRVLEADPRNEEIQAQLLTLDQAAASVPAAATPVAPTPSQAAATNPASSASGPSRPSPSSATTLVAKAVRPPSPEAPTVEAPATPPPRQKPAATEAAPSAVTQRPPSEPATLAGLETTSLAGSATPPSAPPAIADRVREPRVSTPAPRVSLLDLSVPAAAEIPESPSSTTPPDSGPFVTETMAELYLQQGHREEALRVYHALLEQRPGDTALQVRVSALEAELIAKSVTAPASAPGASVPPAPLPTIRDVLGVIALRRPGFHPDPPRGNGGTPTGAPVSDDALGLLFAGGQVTAEDEGAALALALAFTESNGGGASGASTVQGAPAHRASNELSLDSVFGGGASGSNPSNVSYDQFFARGDSAAQAAGAAAAATDAPDDVAHFAKWLEGLQRR